MAENKTDNKTQTNFAAASTESTVKFVTNNSNGELGFPGGVRIPKGETRQVKDWNKIEDNDVVRAWIDGKQITVSDSESKASKDDDKAKK
jgi:hypothetical protein